MHNLLAQFIEGIPLTGDVRVDMPVFLAHHRRPRTATHCLRVAEEAQRLAVRFGEEESQAELAALLHDISAVFPAQDRNQVARKLGVEVLPEEDAFPMILHQKLSVVLARDIFGVAQPAVLSAIGCHTTLKVGASQLDKIVFLADKIQWDNPGEMPFRERMLAGLQQSLDQAVFVYLDFLWQQRESLRVLHPWMVAAYKDLAS